MSPSFWLYILIYCLAMLLMLGFFHSFIVMENINPKDRELDPLV